jgi:hypothetical protein
MPGRPTIPLGAVTIISGERLSLESYCDEPNTGLCVVKNQDRGAAFTIPRNWLWRLGFKPWRHNGTP